MEVVKRGYQVHVRKRANPFAPRKHACSRFGDEHHYFWDSRQLSAGEREIALSDGERDLLERFARREEGVTAEPGFARFRELFDLAG